MSDVAVLSAAVLARQDDTSSAAVIQLLADDPAFKALAVAEGKLLVQRDREDDEKLEKGIQIGVARGILAANPHVDPVTTINVAGLNALDVVERILQKIPQKDGGNIIVLQGLSGTGKGTTVAKLQKALPQCVTWSNGNVFRAYTYLCMQELGKASGAPLSTLDAAQLAPELLASVEQRVTFEEFNDEFDVAIDKNTRVTDLQNTVLRTQEVSAAVPTVAQLMQGEVIRFGASAVNKLRCAGYNVLMEGRAQTLNHIPSPLRFELVISDVEVLGQRRAAQRVMAAAVQAGGAGLTSMSDKEAQDLVRAVLPSI